MRNRLLTKGMLVIVLGVVGLLIAGSVSAQGPAGQGNLLGTMVDKLDQIIAILTAPPPTVAPREFYQARALPRWTGATATHACAEGFHMANLFEILDPTDLKYDQTREGGPVLPADAGSGPTTNTFGWVRTGRIAASNSNDVGRGNCSAWTSDLASDYGTVAGLTYVPSPSVGEGIGTPTWSAAPATCDSLRSVWCVQDR